MGQTLPNIGIYVPSSGETNYGTSFAVGQAFLDSHDHSGAPHGGVPISGSGIANGSITGIKLNDNAAGIGMSHNVGTHALDVGVDALSTQINGSNQVSTIKASGAEAVTGTDANKAITPSTLSSRLAAPGAIGATTPSTNVFADSVTFTTGQATKAQSYFANGTFVPTIQGTSTVGVGTYSIQLGSYLRINNFVFITVQVTWSAHTGTGDMTLAGIPYQPGLPGGSAGVVFDNIPIPADGFGVVALTGSVTPVIFFMYNLNGAPKLNVVMSNVGSIRLSMVYQV